MARFSSIFPSFFIVTMFLVNAPETLCSTPDQQELVVAADPLETFLARGVTIHERQIVSDRVPTDRVQRPRIDDLFDYLIGSREVGNFL